MYFILKSFLHLSTVIFKYDRMPGIAILAVILCYTNILLAQPIDSAGLEPSKVNLSVNYFLGPPVNDGPTVVKAAFQLQDINEINDEMETFQFTGTLTLTWQDERQAFNPEKENVQEKFYQGNYQFNELSPAWYPEVILANESGMYETNGVLFRIQPDGTCILVSKVSAIAESNLSMRKYPFDSQNLQAVFQILGFDNSEVEFEAIPNTVDSSWQKLQISQWKLTDVRNSTGEQITPYISKKGVSSTFTVEMEVQRKPFHVIRLVVIPLGLIVILSWSVFWIDHSSLGERVNITFVGILTAVAYQIVVGDILPHISYFTLMNGFINLSFLIMCATIAVHLLVGSFARQGKLEVCELIDHRCRWIFPLLYFGLMLLAVIVALYFF